jgi:type III secretion protein L
MGKVTEIIQLKKEGFAISPDCRVLKRQQYAEYCAATEIVSAAQEEADRIISEAKTSAESLKEEGYQDGLMEGKMEMAEQMMDNVANAVEYFAAIESKVINIVMKGVKKVVGTIPSEELIASVVKNALAATRNQKQVTIRVCPEELEVVKKQLDGIITEYPGMTFVDVQADSRLNPGGCILESEMGTVDASVDVQIEAIHRAVTRSFKQLENS